MKGGGMRKLLKGLILLLLGLSLSLGLGLATQEWTLTVTIDASLRLEEIKALPAVGVEFEGHLYRGPAIRTILTELGADIGRLEWVEPWGSDGYHMRYDRLTSKRFTTILAYEKDGQPLGAEEGPLRAIYPGGPKKMMVRMVNRLQAGLGLWRLTLVLPEQEREFTLEELQRLPSLELQVGEHLFKGLPLVALLRESEIDLARLGVVSAVASDGLAVDYEPQELGEEAPLLAWERDGQPLPGELGTVALLHQGEVQVKRLERLVVAYKAGN
jgi:hypothetical protein